MTIRVGTIVMMRIPSHVTGLCAEAPKSGAVGEVVDGSKFYGEMAPDEHACDFPHNRSQTSSGWWKVPGAWLVPISGPDIDVGETDEIVLKDKKPVEDLV